jgi:hypothetical protein
MRAFQRSFGHECWQPNGPNQRRQITFASPPAAFVRPLHWGCYAALA